MVHYGMWISPAFSLKVIRAFLDTQEDVSGSPKLETQTTIDERRGLVGAVKAFAIRRNLDFSTAFKMVHQRFGVEKIEQIAAPLLPAAVAYVHSLTLQSGLNGEVLDRLPENMRPQPLRNLQGAVINSLYCAEFLYQHRAAIRGANRAGAPRTAAVARAGAPARALADAGAPGRVTLLSSSPPAPPQSRRSSTPRSCRSRPAARRSPPPSASTRSSSSPVRPVAARPPS